MRLDNTTAIAYVNNKGGTHVAELNEIARNMWKWCEQRNIVIYAWYIPSKENTDADRESRVNNIDTEWELHQNAFEKIVRYHSPPEIDLFATRANTKCNLFCAWHKDPGTQRIDAFTQDWSKWYFYAFPPFSLILKTLKKIAIDDATGILIVPDWPAQPWFSIFKAALTKKPLILKSKQNLLTSNYRTHPLAGKLTLLAGEVSGRFLK